jgi:RNA polymerase sigma-B factor
MALTTLTHEAADAADSMELLRRYHCTRDSRLLEVIVEQHMALVRRLARRFDHRGEELDDLLQVALYGLLLAVERFDPDQGFRFTTFAVPTIVGELKRHFRDHRWNVRVPRSVQENYLRVRNAVDRLFQELGRAPTPADIAASVGLSVRDVRRALEAGNSFKALALEHEEDDVDSWVGRRLAQPCRELQSSEHRQQVTELLSCLSEREQRVVRLRFGHDLSQREIGERIGMSQMHVSRVLRRSFDTMRALAG